jgi:hypothetical protein
MNEINELPGEQHYNSTPNESLPWWLQNYEPSLSEWMNYNLPDKGPYDVAEIQAKWSAVAPRLSAWAKPEAVEHAIRMILDGWNGIFNN